MTTVSESFLQLELKRFGELTLRNELQEMENRLKVAILESRPAISDSRCFPYVGHTGSQESARPGGSLISEDTVDMVDSSEILRLDSKDSCNEVTWMKNGRRVSRSQSEKSSDLRRRRQQKILSSQVGSSQVASPRYNSQGYTAMRHSHASSVQVGSESGEGSEGSKHLRFQEVPEESAIVSYPSFASNESMEFKARTHRDEGSTSLSHSMFVKTSVSSFVDMDAEEEQRSWSAFVSSSRFAMISGGAIVLNVILIGIETDYMARNWTARPPLACTILDAVFCLYFLAELVFRIWSFGLQFFYVSWNLFDSLTVALQVGEVLTSELSTSFMTTYQDHVTSSHIGVIRMMRVFRLIRVMRFIRILSAFSSLRMMVVSIMDSLRSLVWTIVLILLAMFITSVYFTQMVTDHKMSLTDDIPIEERKRNFVKSANGSQLLELYGTLPRTMLTLYQTISDGLHWDGAMEPLRVNCSAWMPIVYSLYIAFVTFAMLNVITGVFVESAIQTANEDKKKVLLDQMRQIFVDADADQSGSITWEEFQDQLENPQLQSFLRAVDLDTQEAENLFHLLDVHGNKEIDSDDFVHGAMRIHGFAKAIDLATFMHEFNRHAKRVEKGLEILYGHIRILERSWSLGGGSRQLGRES